MTEQIQITVKGIRYGDGEKETMELTAAGEYLEKDGTRYIRYDEAGEGTDVIRNMIKLRPDCMEMVKKGAVSTRMVFRQGKKTCASYMTPAGQLFMEIQTSHLAVTWLGEGQLEAEAEYTLTINGQCLSENRVTVMAAGVPG